MRVLLLISACLMTVAALAADAKTKKAPPPADEKVDQMEPKYRSVPETYDSTSTIPSGSSAIRNGPLEKKGVNPYQPFGSDQPLYGKQQNGDVP